jgi:ArsR family transcriptional regulator, arsenate/arsenite/antimonite-responsive transcriptional repressor / arsenate reductase (thioredoxin)
MIEPMDIDLSSLQKRAQIHAALGDPARLAVVDTLLVGDASPGEIAHDLGLATNLVAHHIKVLQDAGLLVRIRSEGDRRRIYLHLRHHVLAMLVPPPLSDVQRVVFVCARNSARSQLAAALWNNRARIPATSAGTHPAERVHPKAVAVAKRHGIAINPSTTNRVTDVVTDDDLVIAVCDSAHEILTAKTRRPRLHWSIPDPVAVDTDAAFEAVFQEISGRIDRLISAIRAESGR